MKHATAYRRKDSWYIHSNSKTTVGLWISTEPFVKSPTEAHLASLGESVLKALEDSQQNVSHPTEWEPVFQPMLDLAEVKTWAAFAKGTQCVSFEVTDNGEMLVIPTRNLGAQEGYLPHDNKVFRLPPDSTAESVGKAIQAASALCD